MRRDGTAAVVLRYPPGMSCNGPVELAFLADAWMFDGGYPEDTASEEPEMAKTPTGTGLCGGLVLWAYLDLNQGPHPDQG